MWAVNSLIFFLKLITSSIRWCKVSGSGEILLFGNVEHVIEILDYHWSVWDEWTPTLCYSWHPELCALSQ